MAKLRIDFSVECDECGQKEFADLTVTSSQEAAKDFTNNGWIVKADETQLCPACAEDDE